MGKLKRIIKENQRKKWSDRIDQAILDQRDENHGIQYGESGIPYEQPLKDVHPGLDLALMYAQPGGLATRLLAPSAYKGMAEGIKNGDLSQAIIYGLVPEGKWVEISPRSANINAGNTQKYSMYKAIGKEEHLPSKIASRKQNLVEKGVTPEGEPYVIRKNELSDPTEYKTKMKVLYQEKYSGPSDWANSGKGSHTVRGHKFGGILKRIK